VTGLPGHFAYENLLNQTQSVAVMNGG
jgi:hypothetical protein